MRRFEHAGRRPARELPPDIQRVLSHIEENVFDPDLNVQRIKLECRLRDNNVSSRFRCYMGVTIRDYLESRRMEAAVDLLQEGGSTIMEVAFAVGYNNLQTFYAAFRRRYSCTPDAYRKEARGEHAGEPIDVRSL
jgi:AraC family transcriptional regulator